MKKSIALTVVAFTLFCSSAAMACAKYEQVVIFGDSYSDNGNTFVASGDTYPGFAYTMGRFTDGPVWSEYLTMRMGLDAMDSKRFRNYAYGQAQIEGRVELSTHSLSNSDQAWNFSVPDLAGEIDQYLKEGDAQPNKTLYFVFIGTNDFLNYVPGGEDENNRFVQLKLNELMHQVERMQKLGAKHIVVFNMRDLTKSPLAQQLADQYENHYLEKLQSMIDRFNHSLQNAVADDSSVRIYDVYQFDQRLLGQTTDYDWYRSRYEMNDTRSACYVNEGNYVDRIGERCAEPWTHFFYDRIHPTTYAHKLMGDDVYSIFCKMDE